MRIALVTHVLKRNHGQGRVNYEIARSAAGAGHEVFLLAEEVAPDLREDPRIRWVPVPMAPWPTTLVRSLAFAVRSRRWLGRHHARMDVVHVNGFVTWTVSHVNTAHFVHTGWLRSPVYPFRITRGLNDAYQIVFTWLNSHLERRAFREARVIVAVSHKVEEELRALGLPSDRIRVIPNGVDLNEFYPGPVDRRRLNLPGGFLALFAGDIRTSRKNLDTVLKAVARTPGVQLAIAGDTRGSPFPAMARRLGIGDRVHFLGYRSDVPELMRAADVFVFPSRYEPFGLVLLEAMASGLPVITARSTGGSEVVHPDCGTVLDDAEDTDGLVRALTRLRDDPAARTRMGVRAREAVRGYTWERVARAYLDLYAEIAGTGRARKDEHPGALRERVVG